MQRVSIGRALVRNPRTLPPGIDDLAVFDPHKTRTVPPATAESRLGRLASAGIDLAQVTRELEEEGVEKFAASFRSLLGGLESKTAALAAS